MGVGCLLHQHSASSVSLEAGPRLSTAHLQKPICLWGLVESTEVLLAVMVHFLILPARLP